MRNAPRLSRRQVLAMGAAVPALVVARPVGHLALSALRDRDTLPATAPGFVDDASGMAATRAEVHVLAPASAEGQLRELLARARVEGRGLSVAGARHTMGGQTSSPDGLVADMAEIKDMHLSEDSALLTVGAGARWSDVIPYLHARGRSVAVMQSNSTFSVGGSLSANAHGWQHGRPPIGSTVESLRVLLASGAVVVANRSENRELFSMVLGGYGLFGVILEVTLRVVANEMYRRTQYELPAADYGAAFAEHVEHEPDVGMAYGRVAVCPEHFLERAILTAYHRTAATAFPPLAPSLASPLARAVLRGSVGSDYGKNLRWDLERRFGGEGGAQVCRNQILSEPVSLFKNRDGARTDILHEYFIPSGAFAQFLAEMRRILPKHGQDLLNVTVRSVAEDRDSFLRYADQPMFALVLLFNQARTFEADEAMSSLAQELVDAAIAVSGRHYLPYRLHATRGQLARAYPQATRFFAAKRVYDPELVFRNHFWDRYAA